MEQASDQSSVGQGRRGHNDIALSSTQSDAPSCFTVQKGDLCSRCEAIDLDDLFSTERLSPGNRNRTRGTGIIVMDLEETSAELNYSDCPLCKLFGSIVFQGDASDAHQDANTTCHLIAHSAMEFKIHEESNPERDAALISVVEREIHPVTIPPLLYHLDFYPRGFKLITLLSPAPTGQIFSFKILHPSLYDSDFAKRCISHCRHSHGDICNLLEKEALPFLRLIDCQSRRVLVASPDSEYVALSYVWGTPVPTSASVYQEYLGQQLMDPQSWPKAITDSLQVTLDIGFKYLWVDRYCIQQDDDQDKALQIGKMDLIYANAEVTIIAAAGEGPEFGLPGVAGTLRQQQVALKIGDHHMAASPMDARNRVRESKWATRGWTYQEAILSRRRLIFTDPVIIWDCSSTYCEEGMEIDPDLQHERQLFPGWNHPSSKDSSFFSHVWAFLQRDPTNEYDKLNALCGIFRAYEQKESPIYQLMGVPISLHDEETLFSKRNAASESARKGFLYGLTWTKDICETRKSKSIPNFPSWSWAGWNVVASDQAAIGTGSSEKPRIWIETAESLLLPFPEDVSVLKDFMSRLPRHVQFIHVEARMFTC